MRVQQLFLPSVASQMVSNLACEPGEMISLVGYDQACGRTEENIWKKGLFFN